MREQGILVELMENDRLGFLCYLLTTARYAESSERVLNKAMHVRADINISL